MAPKKPLITRQYEPIWLKLKSMPPREAETIGVSIIANRLLHARIIKAVIKEKWMDIGFKIELDDRRARLDYVKKNSEITFYLTRTLGKDDF